MNDEIDTIALTVFRGLDHYQITGRTITLKIKYSDFRIITRSRSFPSPHCDLLTIVSTAKALLAATEPENKKIRLLDIRLSNFGEESSRRT